MSLFSRGIQDPVSDLVSNDNGRLVAGTASQAAQTTFRAARVRAGRHATLARGPWRSPPRAPLRAPTET